MNEDKKDIKKDLFGNSVVRVKSEPRSANGVNATISNMSEVFIQELFFYIVSLSLLLYYCVMSLIGHDFYSHN